LLHNTNLSNCKTKGPQSVSVNESTQDSNEDITLIIWVPRP